MTVENNELAEIDAALQAKLANEADDNPAPRADDAETIAEEEASRKGWVPKEKYRGDPAKWKPASQFLEDGKRYQKNLETRLERLERENEELKRSGKAFAEYHEQQMQSKQQEIDTAIKQLRVEKSRATADGEHNLAVELEDRIELLKEEKKGLQPTPTPTEDRRGKQPPQDAVNSPIVREWVEDGNEWFDDKPELRQVAFDYANELVNKTEIRGRKFLDMVAEHVREQFPRQFGKPQTTRRNDQVEGAAPASNDRSGGKYTIHDLPAEDLALMRDFVSKGWTTQEKFLKNYFSEEKKIHRTAQK
jgi:hypothetical protein